MKLQELFTPALAEKRRNPELNPKNTGHEEAVKYLQNQSDISNWGVSMTELPKLGINPRSTYNTPVGIYFYPASYYLENKGNRQTLDFQDDAEYIQIFKYSGNVIDLSDFTEEEFSKYVGALRENLSSVAQVIDFEHDPETDSGLESMSDQFEQIVRESRRKALKSTPGGQLWYVLYALSKMAGGYNTAVTATRNSTTWNKLFRLIGIDGAVDMGSGVIHKNEPTQGVIFNPAVVSHVNTVQSHEKVKGLRDRYQKFATDKTVDLSYVKDIIFAIEMRKITFNARYAKECKAILEKCFQYLSEQPREFANNINFEQLNILLKLSNSNSVVAKFYIAFYKARWFKIKALANTLKSEFDNDIANRYTLDGQRIKTAYKHDIAEVNRIMNQLKRFKNLDADVAGMYDYCGSVLQHIDQVAAATKADEDDKI